MNRARHLFRSSVIVIFFLGLVKVTGLVRARLVGAAFGTSPEYDAFTAANQLPEVFVVLISGGALAAAFIPVYSATLGGDRSKESARLANTILTLVLLLMGAVSALGALLAPWITSRLLVPDFSRAGQQLTAELMRIILLQTTLFAVSGVLSSILYARQHFALPALAPVALDLGYLVGIYLFVPGLGIHGLAWGTVVGSVLHILIQTPALWKYRFRYRPALAIEIGGVREIVRLMGPRMVTVGAVQVADLFIVRLTSGLPAGSTSGYIWGYTLMQLPETLLGTAIAIVVFPTMAELYNSGDVAGLKRTAISTLRTIWMLTIPAAVGLVLLGRPAIAVFLQSGAFDEASTRLVYGVLVFFSLRVVAEATLEIVARLFYAQHNTRTPMFAALGWLALNVTLAYLLVGPLGVGGLALASSLAFTVQSTALFFLNRRRLGSLGERELALTITRSLLATAGMALVILLVGQVIQSTLPFLVAAGAAGLATYFLLSFFLGGRELLSLVRLVRARTA
ncbi:MAG: murein biosynthesis integral membrane protein MurJ [Chloroflexi bacterium]|nr:murein biosynthesis integral membrane protein MurJ [Chloroflexota bacterium]MCI0577725.1 murein biosynthesis integral membrane protein MurJ [Chloroflexota bacterium]MCI0643323.1 murein biosynthesis integral membrane protein MurJ [Chloroflexota bacterium]MCI0730226.1 murein biosynthesis integral membrane protein MurJ [Chloroflexota bacterium]